MKILYLFIGILLVLGLGYLLDVLGTINNAIWNGFSQANITPINMGVSFKGDIYAPLIAFTAGFITFMVIIIIATSIKEKR